MMCGFRVHAFVDVTCSSQHGLCVVTCSRIIVIYKVGKFDYEYARWYRLCVWLPKSREKAKIAQDRELKAI